MPRINSYAADHVMRLVRKQSFGVDWLEVVAWLARGLARTSLYFARRSAHRHGNRSEPGSRRRAPRALCWIPPPKAEPGPLEISEFSMNADRVIVIGAHRRL